MTIIWIILAVVWYITGVILLLRGLLRDFNDLSVMDLLLCLIAGIGGSNNWHI